MTSFKSIAGVNYSNWELAYSIDFSDQASWTPANDDVVEIGGVWWQAASQSATGGPEIIPGVGLVLTPRYGSIMWNKNLYENPYVFADISAMVPNLSEKDIICMQWVHDYSASTGDQFPNDEFETVGAQIWNSDLSSAWYGIGIKGFGYENDLTWAPWAGPGATAPGEYSTDTDQTKFRSFEVVFSFTGQTVICSSPSGSTTVLADPLVADYKRLYATGVYGGNNSWESDLSVESNTIKASTARAMLYAVIQDAGGSSGAAATRGFKGIFTKFRVFRSRTS